MATLYAAKETNRRSEPIVKVASQYEHGKLRCIADTYTLTADTASGDIIVFGTIPKGAVVHEVIIATADLDGSGGTLDVGWAATTDTGVTEAADADGFLADVDVTSATTKAMSVQANMAGFQKQFSGSCALTVTTDGDCDATSGTIKVACFYTLD